MKLDSGLPHKGDDGRSSPEIVEQMLAPSLAPTRRSRPTSISSLDYKARKRRNEKLTTTKPGKRKQTPHGQSDQQQQVVQQSMGTRARGSSGPPPKRYDRSDLETMTEEELIHAIYSDPTLSKLAAEISQQSQPAAKTKPSSKPTSAPTGARKTRDRYYRSSDGVVRDSTEYPEHLKEMMDGGVPVTQWFVLAIILGFGLFQLRKSLSLPEKKKNLSRSPKKGGEKSLKGKQKKTKKRGATTKAASTEKVAGKKSQPKVSKAERPTKPSSIPAPVAKPESAPKAKVNKKKKKAKTATAKVDKVESETANKSSSKVKKEGQIGASNNLKEQPLKATTTTSNSSKQDLSSSLIDSASNNVIVEESTSDASDGWTTVSKSGKTKAKSTGPVRRSMEESELQALLTPANIGMYDSMPDLVEEVPTSPMVDRATGNSQLDNGANDVAAKSAETVKNNIPSPEKSLKKKSGKRGDRLVYPKESSGDVTESDAALALMLQKEEEALAKAENGDKAEEVWEEVTSKKKKGGKN